MYLWIFIYFVEFSVQSLDGVDISTTNNICNDSQATDNINNQNETVDHEIALMEKEKNKKMHHNQIQINGASGIDDPIKGSNSQSPYYLRSKSKSKISKDNDIKTKSNKDSLSSTCQLLDNIDDELNFIDDFFADKLKMISKEENIEKPVRQKLQTTINFDLELIKNQGYKKLSFSSEKIFLILSKSIISINLYVEVLKNEIIESLHIDKVQKRYIYNIFYDDDMKIRYEFLFLILIIPEINVITLLYEQTPNPYKIDFDSILLDLRYRFIESLISLIKSYIIAIEATINYYKLTKKISYDNITRFMCDEMKLDINRFRLINLKLVESLTQLSLALNFYSQLNNDNIENMKKRGYNANNSFFFTVFLNANWIKCLSNEETKFFEVEIKQNYLNYKAKIYCEQQIFPNLHRNLYRFLSIFLNKYHDNILISKMENTIFKFKQGNLNFFEIKSDHSIGTKFIISVTQYIYYIYDKYAELLLQYYIDEYAN